MKISLLVRLILKKGQKAQVTDIKNVREDITMGVHILKR